MIAALKEFIENPEIILAINQKNAPLITKEKSPRVSIFNGSVSNVITGLTTILRNTKQAETTTAVKILFTPIPETKYGRENMARTVINQRSKIIFLLYIKIETQQSF